MRTRYYLCVLVAIALSWDTAQAWGGWVSAVLLLHFQSLRHFEAECDDVQHPRSTVFNQDIHEHQVTSIPKSGCLEKSWVDTSNHCCLVVSATGNLAKSGV